jgi:ppGpp synthetase/RelA/SpoT-type nucleotidyltranferase
MPVDPKFEAILNEYREHLPQFREEALNIRNMLQDTFDQAGLTVAGIEQRVKAEESLAGKLELKGGKYQTIDDVTDIVGLRVVTFYSADVDKVAAIVNEAFIVDRRNSVDKRKQHRLDSFGYNSLHYICRLPKTVVDDPEMPLLNELRFEIQMRTALQHVWSTLDHDTGYKGDVKIPHEYMRQFNRMAGMLELMDEEFSRLRNVLVDYRRQMLALEASGQLDSVDLNSETFRRYLEAHPFDRLNQRIAAINQAELYPVPIMPYFRVLQDLGMETLGEVNRLVEEYSDDAYRLAVSQLGATDLDILSENIGIQNLCYVYVLKQGGGPAGLCRILDVLNGYQPGNMTIAKKLFEQAQKLSFE